MEYVVKDLNDRYIEKYLHGVIDDCTLDDYLKVDKIRILINDVINEHKTIDKILNSNEKFSARWNKNNIGTITLGGDTLIIEDGKIFKRLIDDVLKKRNKIEFMVDKAINNRISEISNTVLDRLGNNLIEKYLDKQDEKLEKLNKQLEYIKFESDLEDNVLDLDTIMELSLNSECDAIKLIATEYLLKNTIKE